MVKVCYLCRRRFEKQSTTSFHVFPTNPKRRWNWFRILGLEPVSSRYVYLCSNHFSPDDLLWTPSGLTRALRKSAMPVLSEEFAIVKEEYPEPKFRKDGLIDDEETETASTVSGFDTDFIENERIVESPVQSVINEQLNPNVSPEAPTFLTSVKDEAVEFTEEPVEIILIQKEDVDSLESPTLCINQNNGTETMKLPKQRNDVHDTVFSGNQIIDTPSSSESSDTVTNSANGLCEVKKRFYLCPRYVGDVDTDEALTFDKAKRNWFLAARQMEKQKKQIRKLQQQNRRLKAKVANLQSIIKDLHEKVHDNQLE